MFGYVLPDKPNMRIKDFALYKAYYCGMCKSIKRRSGNVARLGLNYDIVLLSLLAHNVLGVEPTISDEHCVVHPVGKKHPEVKPDAVGDMIADVNTLIAYYKCRDDIIDEGGLKYRIGKGVFSGNYKKARAAMPAVDAALSSNYERLRELEKAGAEGIDPYADVMGEIMTAVGREMFADKLTEDVARLMYQTGRWIYIIDAVDDLRRDLEKGRFNPIANKYESATADEIYNEHKQELEALLQGAEQEIADAYDRVKITVSEPPLSNIVYMGFAARRQQVLNNKGEKCQRIRL